MSNPALICSPQGWKCIDDLLLHSSDFINEDRDFQSLAQIYLDLVFCPTTSASGNCVLALL